MTLSISGFTQSGNTYTLTSDFTTNGWNTVDITQTDATTQIIIDGNNKTITINDVDFNGLFYAGNTGANTTSPTIIKNFKIKSSVNINIALAKITGSVTFQNCHLELFSANINNNGGGLACNSESTSNLKVTFSNCSATIFGKIGQNAGPLIGYIASNSGSIYNITNCKTIVSDNSSENGIKTLGSGAGAFVGSGISNEVTVNTSYCLFNGSMSYGSGIIGGKFLGSSGIIEINNFYAVTNISSIVEPANVNDSSHYSYYLSSYHGGSIPSQFNLQNTFFLNKGIDLSYIYGYFNSTHTLVNNLNGFNKYNNYTDFNTNAHASNSTKIGTETFIIEIAGINNTFYSYSDLSKNDFRLNTSAKSLKIKPSTYLISSPQLFINTSAYSPSTFIETNSNGLIFFKSTDNLKLKTSRGITTSISNPPFVEQNTFFYSVKFTGYFKTSTAGTWTFTTSSDDSSQLFINNNQIVDNSGTHGTRSRSGTLNITAEQYYKIEIYYGQQTGGVGLEVLIKDPSNNNINLNTVIYTDKTSNAESGFLYEYYEGYFRDNFSFFNRKSNIYFKTPISGNVQNVIVYTSETNEFEPGKITINELIINSNGAKQSSSLSEYGSNNYDKTYGDSKFLISPPNINNGNGNITFYSLTPSIVTINSSSGEVTIVGNGVGVIKVLLNETELFYSSFVCVNVYVNPGVLRLTIGINNGTVVYGSNLVSLITTSGLQPGQQITSIVTNIGEKPNVGNYNNVYVVSSTGTGGYLSSNYVITTTSGNVTISNKPLTVRAKDRTITYGDGLVIGTNEWELGSVGSPDSLVSGDSITGVTMLFNGTTTVPNRLPNGTYTNSIIASNVIGTRLNNYTITYVPGTLIVQKKTQIITINAPKQVYKSSGYAKSAILYSSTLVVPDTLKSIDYKFNNSTTVPVSVGTYQITLADNFPTVNYNKLIPYLDTAGTIQFETPMFLLNPASLNLTVDTILATSNFTGSTWSEFQPKSDGTTGVFSNYSVNPKYINVGGYLNNSYILFNTNTNYKNYIQKTSNSTPITLATNGGFTAFFLVYFQNSTAGEAIIDFFVSPTSSRLFIGRDTTTANKLNVTLYCGSTLMINVSTTNTVFTTGSWNIVGIRITNNGASSILDIYNLYTKETTTINQTLTDITPTTLNIFKTTAAKFTVGRLGNAYIFNKSLNDNQITTIIDYIRCVNSNYNYQLKDPEGGIPVAEILEAIPTLNVQQPEYAAFPEYNPGSGTLGFGQSSQSTSFSFTFGYNHDNLLVSLVDELGQTTAPTKSGPTINGDNLTASLTVNSYHPGLVKVNFSSSASVVFPQNLQASVNILFKPRKPSGVSIQKNSTDGSNVIVSLDNIYAKTSGVGNYNVNIAYKLSQSSTNFPNDYILLTNDQITKEINKTVLNVYSGKYIFNVSQILVDGILENLNYDTTYYLKFVLRINNAPSVESDVFSFTTGFAGTNFKDSVTINNRRYTMSPENFSNKNYSSKDLTGIVIGGGDISNVIINGVTMNETMTLIYATVNNLTSINSKYHIFNIRYCTILNSNFSQSTFENSQIGDSTFENCNFSQIKLEKFNYGSSSFLQNEFFRITFNRCNFNDSVLYGSIFDDIIMDITTDPNDIRTRETMVNTLTTDPFDFYYYPDKKIIDFRQCQTIEEQDGLSKKIRDKQLSKMNLTYNIIPENRGAILVPQNSDLPGTSRGVVLTTGALTSIDAATVSVLAALAGQEDFTSDIGGISGNLSGLVPGTIYLTTTYGPNQQPQLYPRGYETTARAIALTGKLPGEIHDEFVADFITTVYGPKPHTNAAANGDVIEYTTIFMAGLVQQGTNNFIETNQNITIGLTGGRTDDYENYQYLVIKHDINGNPYVLENTIAPKRLDANGNGIFDVTLQTGKLYVILAIPYGITPNASSASQDADRFYIDDTNFPILINPIQNQEFDFDSFVKNRSGYSVKTKINFNAIGNADKPAGKFSGNLSSILKILSTGNLTLEFTLPASIAFNEQKITKNITIDKPKITSNSDVTTTLKDKLSIMRQNAEVYTGNFSICKFLIQQFGLLSQDLEADVYINDFNLSTNISLKSGLTFDAPPQCAVITTTINETNDPIAYNKFKERFEKNGIIIKEIVKIITDASSGNIRYTTLDYKNYFAGHVNSTEDSFDMMISPTFSQDDDYTTYEFRTNAFSYWIVCENTNSIRTGGDPMIYPLIGPKYSLASHVKFINLLADYSSSIFINAHVDMLTPSDFPKQIYWDNSFSNTAELKHIYDNTYYRRFFIYFDGDAIEINADTLEVTKLIGLNKIKVLNYKPKTGLKSISFDKTYPLTDTIKAIKIGFDKFIVTITSDIKTDDRHNLELLNVKKYSYAHMSGALISKDQIIKISNLAGPELFEYKSNPFLLINTNK